MARIACQNTNTLVIYCITGSYILHIWQCHSVMHYISQLCSTFLPEMQYISVRTSKKTNWQCQFQFVTQIYTIFLEIHYITRKHCQFVTQIYTAFLEIHYITEAELWQLNLKSTNQRRACSSLIGQFLLNVKFQPISTLLRLCSSLIGYFTSYCIFQLCRVFLEI